MVYDNSYGACLEVRPHPDGCGLEIHAPNKVSKEWYGEISLSLSVEHAEKLSKAIAMAAKAERRKVGSNGLG